MLNINDKSRKSFDDVIAPAKMAINMSGNE